MALTATQKPKAEKAFVYAWEGMDRRGARIKGETRARKHRLVRAELRRQGVNALKVKKKAQPLFSGKKKIKTADIAIFSRQLAP